MSRHGPRTSGHGSTRLPPEYRERLKRYFIATGTVRAVATLETAETTIRRLIDPYALIPPGTVERVRKIIDERVP